MGLLECPECGRKVSDRAEACPGCAHPVAVRKEASEAKSVGGGAPTARPREHRLPARLVVVDGAPASPPAVLAPLAERRVAPTYRFVCYLCGEDEVLLYQPAVVDRHVCATCEEEALVSGVERSRLLHWWPLVLVAVLLVGGAFFYECVPM